jgi:hypothetical protein
VYWDRRVFELDDDFHAFSFDARREVQQRMLVEAQLVEDSVETGGSSFRHSGIVKHLEKRVDVKVRILWAILRIF